MFLEGSFLHLNLTPVYGIEQFPQGARGLAVAVEQIGHLALAHANQLCKFRLGQPEPPPESINLSCCPFFHVSLC
jgi:hypothetical protein